MIAWAHRWLFEDFWVLVWPNAGAVPLCAAVGFLGAYVCRDRIGKGLVRWLHKHHAAHLDELRTRGRL